MINLIPKLFKKGLAVPHYDINIANLVFVHVSLLFLRSKNRTLALENVIQQNKLVKSKVYVQDPNKVFFNFSKHGQGGYEKWPLAKRLNFSLARKYLD